MATPVLCKSGDTMDQNGNDNFTKEVPMETDDHIPDLKTEALAKKELGNKAYSSKRYREATTLYTEAIRLDPTCAAYYGNRAAAYMMYQEFRLALDDANHAISLDSSFIKAYLRAAKCLMATGKTELAMRLINNALKMEPKNKTLLTEHRSVKAMIDLESQSATAYEKEDYRKIEYCMRKLLEYAPHCHTYKGFQAESLALTGRLNEAQVIANEILRKDSHHAEALFVRGLCLYYQDQTDRACRLFQQLLKVDPDFKKAKETYKKAKKLESTKALGNEAFKSHKFTKALELYTEALAIDPLNKGTNSKLYFNRATVNFKLAKHENSIKDCTSAIGLDPSYIKAYLRRAKCYTDTEQYQEAVNDYEKVNKMDHSSDYRSMLRDAKLELKKSQRKDYYKILNVPKTANETDIKKAYRKEALKHHPDRHANASEEERKNEEKIFKEVNEAYSILSDPTKKQRYDSGQDLEECGGFSDMGGFDPNIIFQSFFGGGGGGGGGCHRGGGGGGHHTGFSYSFG